MSGQAARRRESAASAAQYVLLGGFACVAAGISAQGLTGFARANMGLTGPWPYLLFFALDGAAGVCAVLLMRRAARAESGLAPRLAVWGLVTASAVFNASHAPRRPAAPEAFALMPVVAAVLFEFSLRELRQRSAGKAGRTLAGLGWLHPAEQVRVRLLLASDPATDVAAATRHVRIQQAARRLHRLRQLMHTQENDAASSATARKRIRRAEKRAHAALTRAGFTDPDTAAEVLRQVQVLTITRDLAALDYTTADHARTALGNLITGPARPGGPVREPLQEPAIPEQAAAPALNGHAPVPAVSTAEPRSASGPASRPVPAPGAALPRAEAAGTAADDQLIAAARAIVAASARDGNRLSQTALAERLRSQGHSIGNARLRWLSEESGLDTRHG